MGGFHIIESAPIYISFAQIVNEQCFFCRHEERRQCLCFVESGKSNMIFWSSYFDKTCYFLVVYYVFQYFV
jgi:hypothetical protein